MIDLWGEFGAPFDCHLLRESWPGSDGFGFVELKGRTGINLDLYFVCFFFWVLNFERFVEMIIISVSTNFPAKIWWVDQRDSRTWWKKPQGLKGQKTSKWWCLFGNWNETTAGPVVKNAPKGRQSSASIQLQISLLRVRELCTGEASSNLGTKFVCSPPFFFFSEVVLKNWIWNKTSSRPRQTASGDAKWRWWFLERCGMTC